MDLCEPTHHFRLPHGGQLTYRRWAARTDPARMRQGVVVCLHGWGDHGGRSAGLAGQLTQLGLDCFAPDFAGHGRSDGPRARIHRFDDLLTALHALVLQVARGAPVLLVGHSMGGCLAAHFAIRHPSMTAGFVSCGGALGPNPRLPRVRSQLSMLIGQALPRMPLGKVKRPQDMARSPFAQSAYARDRLVHHGGIDAGTARSLLSAQAWVQQHAGQLQRPFLALQGDGDRLVSTTAADALCAAAPGLGTVVHYPGLRHDLALELGHTALAVPISQWLERLAWPARPGNTAPAVAARAALQA